MSKHNKIICVLVVYTFLGFIIYSNTIGGKFLFDDNDTIVGNTYIRDFKHIKEIFTQDVTAGSGSIIGWYRPVLLLSYTVDYSIWQLSYYGYHLINILLQIFSSIVLFFIVFKLFNKIRTSFLSGLIFLIHPVQTEAVSYISDRADLLLVFFLLISLLALQFFMEVEDTRKRIILLSLSLGSFIVAPPPIY